VQAPGGSTDDWPLPLTRQSNVRPPPNDSADLALEINHPAGPNPSLKPNVAPQPTKPRIDIVQKAENSNAMQGHAIAPTNFDAPALPNSAPIKSGQKTAPPPTEPALTSFDARDVETIRSDFKNAIADLESSNSGGYGARNPPTGSWVAVGRYQMQKPGLKIAGFLDSAGNWAGPMAKEYDVHNLDDFLRNSSAQETAFAIYMADNQRQLVTGGVTSAIGQRVQGLEAPFNITFAGLMAAAHKEGAGAVKYYVEFLKRNSWNSSAIVGSKYEKELRRIEFRLRTFNGMNYFKDAEKDL
jgi:hypothetical protein